LQAAAQLQGRCWTRDSVGRAAQNLLGDRISRTDFAFWRAAIATRSRPAIQDRLAAARRADLDGVYLLTTTAADWRCADLTRSDR